MKLHILPCTSVNKELCPLRSGSYISNFKYLMKHLSQYFKHFVKHLLSLSQVHLVPRAMRCEELPQAVSH